MINDDRLSALAEQDDPGRFNIGVITRAPSLPETVGAMLRDAILANRLRPGQRLVEQKLATAFAISQPTVREALRELENQGFVRKLQNRGTYVTELSAEEYRQGHDVRMTLESLAMERAALNVTPEALRDLEQLLGRLATAAREADPAGYHENDMDFHRLIWRLTGNDCLFRTLERITFGLFAFALLGCTPGGVGPDLLAAIEQHQSILEGLRTRNPAVAREAFVRATLQFWKEQHHVEIGTAPQSPYGLNCSSS
jgi:DNA-binding GntR family transcriptional regulator